MGNLILSGKKAIGAACLFLGLNSCNSTGTGEPQWNYIQEKTTNFCHKAISDDSLDADDWREIILQERRDNKNYTLHRILELEGFINSLLDASGADEITKRYKELWDNIRTEQLKEGHEIEKRYKGNYSDSAYTNELENMRIQHLIDIYMFMSEDRNLYRFLIGFCYPKRTT